MVKNIMKIENNRKGFVLLYAILTATVVAAIGAVFISIITRQITLSIIGRDSQIAFYAADSALSCFVAYTEDNMLGGFMPKEEDYIFVGFNDESIMCGDSSFDPDSISWDNSFSDGQIVSGGNRRELVDDLEVYFSNGSCALVNIEQVARQEVRNVIRVIGYSSGTDGECPRMSDRTVARGLETSSD